MSESIRQAARSVAQAEAAAEIADEELAAAHRAADAVRDRKAALVAERDGIAAARRAGGEVDGARLALIGLDLEELEGLLAAATSTVAAAQVKADEARGAVSLVRQMLDLVKDDELIARLVPHADSLATKLAETMAEIKAAETRLGRSPTWVPLSAFAMEIRKLELLSGGRR